MGRAIADVLENPVAATDMRCAARQRFVDDYLVPTYLTRYLRLIEAVSD